MSIRLFLMLKSMVWIDMESILESDRDCRLSSSLYLGALLVIFGSHYVCYLRHVCVIALYFLYKLSLPNLSTRELICEREGSWKKRATSTSRYKICVTYNQNSRWSFQIHLHACHATECLQNTNKTVGLYRVICGQGKRVHGAWWVVGGVLQYVARGPVMQTLSRSQWRGLQTSLGEFNKAIQTFGP